MNRAEAIKIIRETYHTEEELNALETLIPELKESEESEEERVRKDIIGLIKFALNDGSAVSPGSHTTKEEALAYLEKQKEQKPVEKEITLTSFEGTLNTFLFDFANSPIEDCEPKEYIKKHSAEILKAAYKELNAKLQQDIFEARQEGIRDGYEAAKAEQKPVEIAPNQFDGITYGMQGYSTEKPAEWNEEDETIRHGIECLIMFALQDGSSIAPGCATTKEQALNWLKSLRPSWRPSEEQMSALKEAYESYDFCDGERNALESLYEQLKQL